MKTVFMKKIDQDYQLLLHEMKSLKSMAEFMWQHKEAKRQSVYKGFE